jgi:hypothetical protein
LAKENIGLYRDDGLAIIKSKSARLLDKTRKELHKIFEKFDLKITAEVKLNIVNFLDVTFDMNNAKHKQYRKPNDDPLYINRHNIYITRALIRPSKHGRLSCRCCFIKQLLYGFRVWMAWSKLLAMLLELRKARKITRLRLVFRVLFLTLATFPRVWIRPFKHGNHKVIVYSNHPPSITRQLPTAISTNASHFSHWTNKHLRNLRLFTRTPLAYT